MKAEILNVRLPSEIVRWLDDLVKQGIYKSRSEAARGFIRDYLRSIKGDRSER